MRATQPLPVLPGRYALLGVLGLVLTVSACGRADGSAQKMAPAEVGVVTAVNRQVELADEFNGRVEAVSAVDLRPRVSGYLQKVAYREGDLVSQGAILFVVDQRPYRIALDQAAAQLSKAKSTAQLADTQLKRVGTLLATRAASQEELDNVKATSEQAKADLQAAEAAVANARLNLDYTEVRAPISGRVGRAMITAGNLAVADQSLLTTVVSQDSVYVYFDCDEQSYLRYNTLRDRTSSQAISKNVVRVKLANESSYGHEGKVDFLDNKLDPVTGTIKARVRLDNPDGAFTPGLFARVQLVGGVPKNALLVDEKAVLTDQDQKYVYVVGKNSTAERRNVSLGPLVSGKRVIETGVSAGDRVIVDGLQIIFFPGAPVSPSSEDKEKAVGSAPRQS